jgi:uncharacterized membrane protein
MEFTRVVEILGTVVDGAGVAVIVVGVVSAVIVAARALLAHTAGVYPMFRRHLGRSILLGLELLVAADIIRTVAVTPTMGSVAVLGVIVVIRTFLSFSLELEITGRWPWQQRGSDGDAAASSAAAAD